jgi:hypothetical protein
MSREYEYPNRMLLDLGPKQVLVIESIHVSSRMPTGYMIRLKHIYNFLCSMLVYTQFALCFVTLCGVFMHFPELTY